MMYLVFLLEGPSEKAMLEGVLPRILPAEIVAHYIVFEGKQDLEKRMVMKIRGWRRPGTHFIVLRDKDAGDCVAIKARLSELCRKAGREDALVRIACHEVESWYLGDLVAVEQALGIVGIAKQQAKAKYRNPDTLANAAKELVALTKGEYQKLAGSRKIGPHLRLDKNASRSFNVFLAGVDRILGEAG